MAKARAEARRPQRAAIYSRLRPAAASRTRTPKIGHSRRQCIFQVLMGGHNDTYGALGCLMIQRGSGRAAASSIQETKLSMN